MNQSSGLIVRISRRVGIALAMLLCSVIATSAFADPPGRVGRLADLNGTVWLYSPDAGEWIAAQRNRPLTNGDRISTEAGARAEVRIGSTTVRLDSGTELEVLAIDDDHLSLQLHSGSVAARVRSAESAREFELKTEEGRFLVERPGAYRFDRNDASSDVTVWNGQAHYEGPGSALTVNANQRAEFWIDRSNAAQYSITEPQSDPFATWNGERDRHDDRSASTRYVSPEMTGVEDLDRYGRWEQAPDYGNVWIPRGVPSGWAPYGAGHWAWVSPWGWTWVDDMPWGFAPFHYGRWVMFRERWCWVPGTYVRRPVYAPALVGWVGGPHLSVSISIGGGRGPAVGWFPLAPREVYVPTYQVSPTYVRNVNVTHVTNITNVTTIINNPQTVVNNTDYVNRRYHHGVTVVPQSVMTSRQPVAPAAAQLRDSPAGREMANQPAAQRVALAAPPVAAPVAAAVLARRMHQDAQQQGGAPNRAAPGAAGVVAPQVAVPPPPGRVANLAPGRVGEREHDRRGPEGRDGARPGTPVAVPPAAGVQTAPQAPARVTTTAAPQAAPVVPAPQVAPVAPAPRVVPPPPNRATVTPAEAPQAGPPGERHGRQRGGENPQPPAQPVGARAPQPDPNAAAAAQAQAQMRAQAQEAQARAHVQAQAQQEAQARAQAQAAQMKAQAQAQQEAQARAHMPPRAPQEAQARAQVQAQQEAQAKAQAVARAEEKEKQRKEELHKGRDDRHPERER